MPSYTFSLRPKPPFRLDFTAWALRRRARNIVDRWDGATYRRVVVFDGSPVEVAVTQAGSIERPKLSVTVTGKSSATAHKNISQLLTRVLGLQTNLRPFYALARHDKRLAPVVRQFRGLKPPRFPSAFEGMVNAIACQQLSLTVGIELLNRLSHECGPQITCGGDTQHGFPGPEDVLKLSAHKLRHLGFSYRKARSLLQLSRSIATGKFNPEELNLVDNDVAVSALKQLRGIGRWTAEYVLLRGFGRIDVFPGDDVGAQNRLALWLKRKGPLDYEGVRRVLRKWHPYAGLVYFHLLLAGLTQSGEMHTDTAHLSA